MKRLCASLLVGLLCLEFAGCAAVRQQLGMALVPLETEIELGKKIAAQIEEQEKVLQHPAIQAYVRQVAAPLVERARADRPGMDYRFTVLDDAAQVNAFAVPGGHIYAYTGLLLAAGDEAELAGVLAHEIGHIAGRHSAEQLATQFGLDLLGRMALGEEPNALAQVAAQLASASALARFSREDESEADEYGVRYVLAAGYDAGGLLRFFEKLQALEGARSGGLAAILATHPPTAERIRHIEALIARAGHPEGRREAERFARQTAPLRP